MKEQANLLPEWAERETDLRALLRSIGDTGPHYDEDEKMIASKSAMKKIARMIEVIVFAATNDWQTSMIRHSKIGDVMGVDRRTILRYMRAAESLSLLSNEKRSFAGRRTTNQVTINWDNIKNFCLDHVATKCHRRCDKMSPPLRQNVATITTSYQPNNYQEPVPKKIDDAFGGLQDFVLVDQLAEVIERGLKLTRDIDARRECQRLAEEIAVGEYERTQIHDSIRETLKHRPGKQPPRTPVARLRYFKSVLRSKSDQWVMR